MDGKENAKYVIVTFYYYDILFASHLLSHIGILIDEIRTVEIDLYTTLKNLIPMVEKNLLCSGMHKIIQYC